MRRKYVPVREIRCNVANGMNAPKQGRFGRVREAFIRDSSYYGENGQHYIVASVNRDSGAVDRANWEAMVLAIPSATIERASHWACGWVDYLLVAPGDRAGLREAIYCHSSLSQYPILDDEIHSRIEDEDCWQVWEDCYNASERVAYFRKHGHSGGFRELLAAVRGDWRAAASVLNSPSDLAHN